MKKYSILLVLLVIILQVQGYYFGQNKIQARKINWAKMETMHFDIYFDENDPEFGKIAALMAEEAYYFLKQDLILPVRKRIPLVFYPSHQDFETTNIIFPLLNDAVGGFTETARNRVAVPFDGSFLKLEEVLIHELTHAYLNELNRNNIKLVDFNSLPFWFSEGFPEFQSVQGKSVYNNMFIIDMLLNGYLYDLQMVGGFYAYREGESFLTFVSEEYGRKKVIELFYALKMTSNIDHASQKVFGVEFKIIQERWKNYLKRQYFPIYSDYNVPTEVYERKTNHNEDGSFMNYAPRFSPDGNNYLYFSNRNLRNSIWNGSTLDLVKDKKIVTGEASGKFEEFHFRRNNISWFPDGKTFAFVSKTATGDVLYFMDYKSKKILQEITFDGIDVVFEFDISDDGEKIVFAGQKDHKTDIFTYQIASKELKQITNDRYYDYQPSWSHDGTKIVFSSERDRQKEEEHIFYRLTSNIYYYNLGSKQFFQVTNDDFNNYFPIFSSDDKQIIMITEREIMSNFEIVNLESGNRASVTNSIGGVFSGDLNSDDSMLVFSCFYQGGWDIYTFSNPLEDLQYENYQTPFEVEMEADLYSSFEIDRYKKFGYRERKFRKVLPEITRENATRIEIGNIAERDSLNKKYNEDIDKKPVSEKIPLIKPYKVKFSLDSIWGGMAYSASGGAFGQLQLSMSDLMGNHYLGFNFGVYRELKNSDVIVNYLYLAHRIDYGFGSFYINDDIIYRIDHAYDTDVDYMRERERQYGIYNILRYPFNKFWRLDWENTIQKYEMRRDWWDENHWEEEFLPDSFQEQFPDYPVFEDELIYRPQFTLTYDNSLYGSVGPILGWRSAFVVNSHFSDDKPTFGMIYGDFRKYWLFQKRYCLAARAFGGWLIGDTNRYFELDGFYDVRGYDEDDEEELANVQEGTKKLITSFELRFPFVDNLKIAFPLPLYFYNIRGAAYMDIGSVWNNPDDFDFYDGRALQDVKLGFGFGPRFNMGFFIVKFDIAWNSDLYQTSKPTFYWSLTENF